MFPRPDGVLLAGTFELGDWSLEVNRDEEHRVLSEDLLRRAGTAEAMLEIRGHVLGAERIELHAHREPCRK